MTSRQSDDSPKRKGPRNYLARREQVRLLMLVGSLMLVIILMNQARKPGNWAWLTRVQGEQPTEDELGGGEIDTRTVPGGIGRNPSDFVPGMIVEPSFRFERKGEIDDEETAYRRAEKEFWEQQLELLGAEHRRRIPRLLKGVRDDQPHDGEEAEKWNETLALIDERWEEYTQKAVRSVTLDTQLSDQDRGTWLTILERLQTHWRADLHSALAVAATPSALTPQQREELDKFQRLFDELSMEGIVDGTPIPWPNETNAWFRLVEDLNTADQQALAGTEMSYVGFRQLYQQPDEYRGRLIRVRGAAHRAYHLAAPTNIAGIEGYYKFIISLAGHPDDPVIVYALDLPEGFPEVKDLNFDKEVTDLVDVDVEFTGYFFKLAAYQSGDGIRVAPLLLAKAPTWTPRPPPSQPEPPNMWLLLAALVGAALLGTAVAVFVMTRHGATPSQVYKPSASAHPQFAALGEQNIPNDPSQGLRELSQEEGANESPSE